MASWLYECLCEADLDKYYPCFVAVGLQRTEQLADITMKDYPKLGVHNMEDRKRLFQLIKIVQSVQEEDQVEDDVTRQSFEPGCVYLQPESARSGPRRQLKFDSFFVMNEELEDCELAFRNVPEVYANKHKAGLLQMARHVLPEDSRNCNKARGDNGASTCTQQELDLKETSDVSTLLGENEVPVFQRVTHVSGYNYGVPHSCIRANNCENEGPWTGSDKIRVCVRKRPLGVREERRGEVNVVTVEDKETVLIHEKKEAVDLKQYILQHVFYFDEVFSEALSNRDVYMRTAYPLIQHIFSGGHASCFAYGQTGAGKTYTMIGTPQNPGLYALAAKDIFGQLQSSQPKRNLLVWISFYEIYCGQLYDLLNGRKRLFAREDGNHVVQIVGLREIQVESVDLLLEVIVKGSRERSTGATGVNSDSSRSHAIIQIQVKDSAGRMFGRMSFIDLAGSERAADARESDKQTKFEGAEINQSLLALKECIRALDQEHSHTPFRQSKLTQVLKDSFIGNSKTCMIANISPSHVATEHTLNTLRYADRVKELKKGMKWCNPVTSRSRTVGSSSPKRVQNPSSVHHGEKNSPKKVKLGLQNPPNPSLGPSKLRKYPSVFHPLNIPLSSTPKAASKISPFKGNSVQPWLNRTTPVKGLIKGGKLSKKRAEDLAWHAEKMKGMPVGVRASEARESHQGDCLIQHDGSLRAQKVQAVRPVQKQIVPRNKLAFGDVHHRLSDGRTPDHMNQLTEKNSELGTNEILLQKEKEQHLRFYHQQFQQPPILQQKLKYQPLEKFLATYRPQEIQIQHDSDHQHPTCLLSEDGTQLEDLDDSDFSEDSFSYASNQSKKKKRGNIDRYHHSFFLHHKEFGSVEDQNKATGETLFSEYGACTQESNQSDRLCFTGESASPTTNNIIHKDSIKSHSDWCAEDESPTSLSSQNNNTAEKPYSYQEDLACKWKHRKEFTAEYEHHVKNKCQQDSNASLSLQETCNSSVSSVLDDDVAETKDRTSGHHAFMEASAGEQHGSAEGHRQQENESNEGNHCKMLNISTGSGSGLMDPLTVSLLESERTTAWDDVLCHQSQERCLQVEHDSGTFNSDKKREAESRLSPERNKTLSSSGSMSEFIKQMLKYDQMALQASRETEKELLMQTFDNSKYLCSLEDSPASSSHQGSVNDKYFLEAPTSNPCLSYRDDEDTLFSKNHESREYINSRQYDADTEETILRIYSPESSPNLDMKDIQPTKESQESYMSVVSLVGSKDGREHVPDAPISKSPSMPKVTGNLKWEKNVHPKENNILQVGSHSNCKELNNLDDTLKFSTPNEESGVLNNKMLHTIFMHNNCITTEHDSGSLDNKINYSAILKPLRRLASTGSQTSISEISSHNEKTLGRAQQLVVQAHREQLEEMTALGFKEECLLRKMSPSDFKDYVTKVDEIMLLKSKCIQSMRAQLQLYMACPGSIDPEERTPAS